ncbi:hypothetical protein RHSIM_Rhsim05G0222300 [Rhododendron simsii]|uniref:Nop domain-containing protein n=1 Tax=Rhododendron simsii TaxID=118357 RepID=A0A834LNH5_RHOSS|nr:hypothetical protein RHSIM_Rhsim05G0222300 [Rhododendron simsii]
MATRFSEQVNNKMATLTISDNSMEQDDDNLEEDVLDGVSKLHKTRCYISIMQEVEKMSTILSNQGVLIEQGPDTKLIVLHYIGNEMDIALIDLKEVLSPADIGCNSISANCGAGEATPRSSSPRGASGSVGRWLRDGFRSHGKVLAFVGSITEYFAPNLCAVFGSEVDSKLIVGTAGGLSALANMILASWKFYSGSACRLGERRSNRMLLAFGGDCYGEVGENTGEEAADNEGTVINLVDWDEGWGERRAKLEAIKKWRAVF